MEKLHVEAKAQMDVAIYTGMRKDEESAAIWSHVDLDGRYFYPIRNPAQALSLD